MENPNKTSVTVFFLHGLAGCPVFYLVFFLLCLIMYMVILLNNSFLIAIIILDSHLHTLMYFFLRSLFSEHLLHIFFHSMLLVNFLSEEKSISFIGCGLQMFFSFAMGSTECVLLSAVTFDHYVAICSPLRCTIIMNKGLSVKMVTGCWMTGGLTSSIQTSLAMHLTFCGNIIDHLTCEILAVLKLACEDMSLNVIMMVISNIFILVIPMVFIFISYFFILFTILRINSVEGRKKAFSTCSSHLTVVMFYGTSLFMYMKSESKDSHATDELIAIFYAVVIPMLNPIIYSLRNKDVKAAVIKLSKKYLFTENMRDCITPII